MQPISKYLFMVVFPGFQNERTLQKIAKRLDCARFSGAFGRTKPYEPPTLPARVKSGAEAAAV
jgi:hypothetical protein